MYVPYYFISEIILQISLTDFISAICSGSKETSNAVKIQTYTADTITLDCDTEDFQIHGGLWDGYNYYRLYQEAYTPWEWHKELFEYAKEIGICLFSTPFENLQYRNQVL